MRRLVLSLVLCLPTGLMAEDAALVLGVDRYERLDRVRRATDLLDAEERLEALGFVVRARGNGRADTVRDLAGAFAGDADGAGRLVVALSGHFVTDGDRSWWLSAEADTPTLFDVDAQGLSIESLLTVLATRPGQAVLLLGDSGSDDIRTGPFLAPGLGDMAIPQGVGVIRSTPESIAALLNGAMTEPLADIGAAVRSDRTLEALGYAPPEWVFMPDEVIVDGPVDPGPTEDQINAEAAAWDDATRIDTVAAYRAYIRAYPAGRFVEVAEEKITGILAEPNRDARLAEEALNLSRADRRAIQGDLTVLGYNTRGVDGIFGPGTRRAVSNWQQSNGYPQTSYVSRDQINRLNAQAERRRAEIAAEEAREQARRDRLDREYWAETGANRDEPGYRAYLNRYPEGLFAEIARDRLAAIEEERSREAEVADRAAWGIAAATHTVDAYQDYLAAWPDGVFAEEARTRIAALSGTSVTDEQIATARRQEEALQLSGVRAQLLELRLRDLGLQPGPLDGVIDDRTRAALKTYQEAQGVPPTGYVDQATLVRLMAGGRAR